MAFSIFSMRAMAMKLSAIVKLVAYLRIQIASE